MDTLMVNQVAAVVISQLVVPLIGIVGGLITAFITGHLHGRAQQRALHLAAMTGSEIRAVAPNLVSRAVAAATVQKPVAPTPAEPPKV